MFVAAARHDSRPMVKQRFLWKQWAESAHPVWCEGVEKSPQPLKLQKLARVGVKSSTDPLIWTGKVPGDWEES